MSSVKETVRITHFKYMTFIDQRKIFKDTLVLLVPQRNEKETVSLKQILNANSNVC